MEIALTVILTADLELERVGYVDTLDAAWIDEPVSLDDRRLAERYRTLLLLPSATERSSRARATLRGTGLVRVVISLGDGICIAGSMVDGEWVDEQPDAATLIRRAATRSAWHSMLEAAPGTSQHSNAVAELKVAGYRTPLEIAPNRRSRRGVTNRPEPVVAPGLGAEDWISSMLDREPDSSGRSPDVGRPNRASRRRAAVDVGAVLTRFVERRSIAPTWQPSDPVLALTRAAAAPPRCAAAT